MFKTVTEVFVVFILRTEENGKDRIIRGRQYRKNLDTEPQARGWGWQGVKERGERKKENGGRGGETESL